MKDFEGGFIVDFIGCEESRLQKKTTSNKKQKGAATKTNVLISNCMHRKHEIKLLLTSKSKGRFPERPQTTKSVCFSGSCKGMCGASFKSHDI